MALGIDFTAGDYSIKNVETGQVHTGTAVLEDEYGIYIEFADLLIENPTPPRRGEVRTPGPVRAFFDVEQLIPGQELMGNLADGTIGSFQVA